MYKELLLCFNKILSLLLFIWPLKSNNLSFLSLVLFPHLLMGRFNGVYQEK